MKATGPALTWHRRGHFHTKNTRRIEGSTVNPHKTKLIYAKLADILSQFDLEEKSVVSNALAIKK
jgi:hypothetical protein